MAKTTIAEVSQAVAVLVQRIDGVDAKLFDTATAVARVADDRQGIAWSWRC